MGEGTRAADSGEWAIYTANAAVSSRFTTESLRKGLAAWEFAHHSAAPLLCPLLPNESDAINTRSVNSLRLARTAFIRSLRLGNWIVFGPGFPDLLLILLYLFLQCGKRLGLERHFVHAQVAKLQAANRLGRRRLSPTSVFRVVKTQAAFEGDRRRKDAARRAANHGRQIAAGRKNVRIVASADDDRLTLVGVAHVIKLCVDPRLTGRFETKPLAKPAFLQRGQSRLPL